MAIYEFKCQSCDHQFEVIQKMSDPYPTKCPECGKEELKKLVSANTGTCFMGHGWTKPGMTASTRKVKT